MGGNESKGVGSESEGEGGIYRDLLEVDGCESGWQDGGGEERRAAPVQVAEVVGVVEELKAVASHVEKVDDSGAVGNLEMGDTRLNWKPPVREQAAVDEERQLWEALPFHQYVKERGRVSILTNEDGELLISPEGRPLAEPPMFNYDLFVREEVPSDGKLKLMFGNDKALMTRFRDREIETGMRRLFSSWLWNVETEPQNWDDNGAIWENSQNCFSNVSASRKNRCHFYHDLREAFGESEEEAVVNEVVPMTGLQVWQSIHLDNDDENGNTTTLLNDIRKGLDPFSDILGAKDAERMYGHLLSTVPWGGKRTVEAWLFHAIMTGWIDGDGGVRPFRLSQGRPAEFDLFGGVEAQRAFEAFESKLDDGSTILERHEWYPGLEVVLLERLTKWFPEELRNALEAALAKPEPSPFLQMALKRPEVWKCARLELPS